jgi:DNA polymerase III subunit epsilon
MRWLDRLIARDPSRGAVAASATFAVVDVESSGLDVRSDRLVAIGAVALEAGRIAIGRELYVVLRQDEPSSRENVLVHGIGHGEQRAGIEPAAALDAFAAFVGDAPLVGFNAAFDAAMIERAHRQLGRRWLGRPWLDLALLAPAIDDSGAPLRTSLDEWLARFGIVVAQRHHALADALATAQLAQVLLRRAAARGLTTIGQLQDAAESVSWLRRTSR